MIRQTLHITVGCDGCTDGLTGDPDDLTGVPVLFTDRRAALRALALALDTGGWVRMFDGRLLCAGCAARRTCADRGHGYEPDGWRMCACDRSLPSHATAAPDPAGGDGCGMRWRLCGRCDHIDEHHVTDDDPPDGVRVQPGGYLRQDVPAGLVLPTHTPIRSLTSEHETSRETLMVEPDHPARGDHGGDHGATDDGPNNTPEWPSCGATRRPGSRWVCREDSGHAPALAHRDAMGDRWCTDISGGGVR